MAFPQVLQVRLGIVCVAFLLFLFQYLSFKIVMRITQMRNHSCCRVFKSPQLLSPSDPAPLYSNQSVQTILRSYHFDLNNNQHQVLVIQTLHIPRNLISVMYSSCILRVACFNPHYCILIFCITSFCQYLFSHLFLITLELSSQSLHC